MSVQFSQFSSTTKQKMQKVAAYSAKYSALVYTTLERMIKENKTIHSRQYISNIIIVLDSKLHYMTTKQQYQLTQKFHTISRSSTVYADNYVHICCLNS